MFSTATRQSRLSTRARPISCFSRASTKKSRQPMSLPSTFVPGNPAVVAGIGHWFGTGNAGSRYGGSSAQAQATESQASPHSTLPRICLWCLCTALLVMACTGLEWTHILWNASAALKLKTPCVGCGSAHYPPFSALSTEDFTACQWTVDPGKGGATGCGQGDHRSRVIENERFFRPQADRSAGSLAASEFFHGRLREQGNKRAVAANTRGFRLQCRRCIPQ